MNQIEIMHSFNTLRSACDQHLSPTTKLARDHIRIVEALLQSQYGKTFEEINREVW